MLKENKRLKKLYRGMRAGLFAALYDLSPVAFAKISYRKIRGRWPDLENPQSFDEKLLWLNLYWRDPLKVQCADKYEMRSYVTQKSLGHLLPNLLGVYDHVREIDFATLPNRFVLKCTHGCGFNVICKDKAGLDVDAAKRRLNKWMHANFAKVYGEVHYGAMNPRIIAEEFLEALDSDLPSDYKIFCFAGKPHCTMACTNRTFEGNAKYDFYDLEWKTKLAYSRTSLLADRHIAKPPAYDEMLAAAGKLAEPFPFVRLDFYSVKGKAVIGEMTFTPTSNIDVNLTDLGQSALGGLIQLPEKSRRGGKL